VAPSRSLTIRTGSAWAWSQAREDRQHAVRGWDATVMARPCDEPRGTSKPNHQDTCGPSGRCVTVRQGTGQCRGSHAVSRPSATAQDVKINIGLAVPPPIILTTPPPLVVVPGTSVSFALDVNANVYFYRGHSYTVVNDV
jgi:hypothetical protein